MFEEFSSQLTFVLSTHKNCLQRSLSIKVSVLNTTIVDQPAQAVSQGMFAAYLEGAEYFYKIDDRIVFITENWTLPFIRTLKNLEPPNVGVVGPNHQGGYTSIITYEFVHKTHINIHGHHYPKSFVNWYADSWISRIYEPYNLFKVDYITVLHTVSAADTSVHIDHQQMGKLVRQEVRQTKNVLKKYTDNVLKFNKKPKTYNMLPSPKQSKNVISISLTGRTNKIAEQIIYNIGRLKLFYPDWVIRVYMENPSNCRYEAIDSMILTYLTMSGFEIVYVNTDILQNIYPCMWKYLIGDDTTSHHYIVVDIENLDDFENSRDTRQNNKYFYFNPGYFEALGAVRKVLNKSWMNSAALYCKQTKYDSCENFISKYLWSQISNYVVKKE